MSKPKKKAPNRKTVPVGTRIAKDVDDAYRAFADTRGESLRDVLEMALRRHMANPPPKVDVPPLPSLTVK